MGLPVMSWGRTEMNSTRQVVVKIEFYLISLWLLFASVFLVSFQAPLEDRGNSPSFAFWGHHLWWGDAVAAVSFSLAVIGLWCFRRFVVQIKGAGGVTYSLQSVEDLGYEQIAFLATYIIPFASFELASVRKTLLWAALIGITGMIYISIDKYYANPTLCLMGFKTYKAVYVASSGQRKQVVLVSRQKLQDGSDVRMIAFAEGACFARLAGAVQ